MVTMHIGPWRRTSTLSIWRLLYSPKAGRGRPAPSRGTALQFGNATILVGRRRWRTPLFAPDPLVRLLHLFPLVASADPTAVDRKRHAGDVAGPVGGEKHHRVRELPRLGHAAQWDLSFGMDIERLQPLGSRVARADVI